MSTDINLNLDLEDEPKKKGRKSGKEMVDKFPEHVPLIPYNKQNEQQRAENRRKAQKLRKESGDIEAMVTVADGSIKKVSQLTLDEKEIEIGRCAMSPIYFIETYLTIFDQTQGIDGQIVPFILFDFQKKLINTYLDNRFVIANKYRQAGISTTTCAYIAWYIMFNKNRGVAIIANRLETAKDELMNDVVEFITACPSFLRPKTGKETDDKFKDTQKLKRYDNNSSLGAFSAKGGLRGYTPTLIFWDETAWTEKGDAFWLAARPTLQTGGAAIMVSTPSGLDAVFYKIFEGARKKKNNFTAVELWWFNDPRYNKELVWLKHKGHDNEKKWIDEGWSAQRRIELKDDGWEASSPWFEEQVVDAEGDMRKIAQELLCSFLGSGDNFIAEEYLKRIDENEIRTPIRQEYTDLNMWIFEDPIPGEDYLMSLDASSGHGEDYATVNILKTTEVTEEREYTKNGKKRKKKITRHKIEQVAEYYGKVSPQMLGEIAYQYGKKYNDAYAVADVTGGYGVQAVEKLYDIGYENIHCSEIAHKPTRDRLQGYVKKGMKTMPDGSVSNVDLIPGFFIGQNRPSVLTEMQRAIHLEDVIIRSVRLLTELKTFVTVPGNRVADHKRSFHDDSIMGLATGLYVLNFDMVRYKQSKGMAEKMLNAIMTVNDINEIEKQSKFKHKPMISPNSTSQLNPYGANEWLFSGLNKKNKR